MQPDVTLEIVLHSADKKHMLHLCKWDLKGIRNSRRSRKKVDSGAKKASDRHKQLSVNDLTQSHSSNSNVNVLQFPIRSQRGELKIN